MKELTVSDYENLFNAFVTNPNAITKQKIELCLGRLLAPSLWETKEGLIFVRTELNRAEQGILYSNLDQNTSNALLNWLTNIEKKVVTKLGFW